MDWKILFFCFIGSIAAASNSGWRENTQYKYDVESRTLSGHPDVGSQYSGIILKSGLSIVVRPTGALIGKLSDTQYAKIQTHLPNGPRGHISHDKLHFNKLKMDYHDFEIQVKNGVVKLLRIHKDVPNWEVNMIKSIVTQIQLDTRGENLMNFTNNEVPEVGSYSGAYKTMEESILGEYEVLHEINQLTEIKYQDDPRLVPHPELKGDGEIMEIVKTRNFDQSQKLVGYHFGLGNIRPWKIWGNRMGDFFSRTSGSRVIISGKLDRYTIQSVDTNNEVFISPVHNGDQKIMVFSNYKLSLSEVLVNTRPPPPLSEDTHVDYKSLLYDYGTKESENSGEGGLSSETPDWKIEAIDSSLPSFHPLKIGYGGKSIKSIRGANLTALVITLARNIEHDLKHPEEIPIQGTLAKSIKMQQLMRLLNASELEDAVRELYVVDESGSYDTDSWFAFLDKLAETGTVAALEVFQKLVLRKIVGGNTGGELIAQMVKSVIHPSYDYMRMFYAFSTHPAVQADEYLYTAATLACARLVGDVFVDGQYSHDQYPVYVHGRFDTPEGKRFATDEYIPHLSAELDRAIERGDNKKAQTIILALGKVGHPKILSAFEKYLEGKKDASHSLRTHMVISLWKMVNVFPEVGHPVLNKIYRNPGEHTDVRIAALANLGYTNISADMFQKIAIYSIFDTNKQVNAAVDRMIRTAAAAQGKDDGEWQMNARSALHLLPKRRYGMQHSRVDTMQYVPDSMTYFDVMNVNIAGPDGLFGKTMASSVFVNGGGFEQELISQAFMTNTIEAFTKALFNKTKGSGENGPENDSKWSSEQVRRNLKIKPNLLESPEGNVYGSIADVERFYPFDVKSLNKWPEYVEQFKEDIRKRSKFHLTKIYSPNNFYMGFPTETGLPTWVSSENPMLASIDIDVSGKIEPKGKYHVDLAKLNSTIKFVFSGKAQDRIGFITPFEYEHYMAGHELNVQSYLPLKVKLNADIANSVTEVTLKLATTKSRTPVIHFSTVPYTAQNSILKLQPVLLDSNTHVINAEPKSQLNTVFGKDATGMAWRVRVACEDRVLSSSKIINALGDHSLASSLFMHLFRGYIHNSKLEIEFDSSESVNKHVYFVTTYEMFKDEDSVSRRHHTGFDGIDETEIAKRLLLAKKDNVVDEIKKQSALSFDNPTESLYTTSAVFGGSDIRTTVAYQTVLSIVESESKEHYGVLLNTLKVDARNLEGGYKGVFVLLGHTPSPNAIDPFYALKHSPSSKHRAITLWGDEFETAMKIGASIDMDRSQSRNRYLHGSQIAHDCKKESSQGNVLLEACSKLRRHANLLDQVKIHVRYEDVGSKLQNATNKFLNYAKCGLKHNMDENKVNASGSGKPNTINIRVNFNEEFDFVNVSASTPKRDIHFDNVKVPSAISTSIFAVDSSADVIDRLQSHLFASQKYLASCSVDQTFVNTFDDKTYPSKHNEWTVMFMYQPNQVNKTINSQKNSGEDFSEDYERNEEEYLILTRKMNSEVKITLRAPQTQDRQIEIDMLKSENTVVVVVNQQRHALRSRRVIEVAGGFIKISTLPHGEVQIEIQNTLTVAYDGHRIRLTTPYSNKFVNKVRGLCGNYDSDESNDFYAPETCVYNNVEQFVASYQPYQRNQKPSQSKRNRCSYNRITFADVISKGNLLDKTQPQPCTEFKTVTVAHNNQVCVSIKPQRVCKHGCRGSGLVPVRVLADCSRRSASEENGSSEEQSKSGWTKDLKQLTVLLPLHCTP